MSSPQAYDAHVVRSLRGEEAPAQQPPAPGRPARLAPADRQPNHTVVRVGHNQRLVVEGDRTQYEFHGGSFYMASRALSERLPYLGLTALQYDVWHLLLGKQLPGGVVTMTQAQIADALQTDRKEVRAALQLLEGWGLIYRPGRGRVRLNPLIAFYGSSEHQAQALMEMPLDVPEIRLPEARVRPRSKRPRTGPKGV